MFVLVHLVNVIVAPLKTWLACGKELVSRAAHCVLKAHALCRGSATYGDCLGWHGGKLLNRHWAYQH